VTDSARLPGRDPPVVKAICSGWSVMGCPRRQGEYTFVMLLKHSIIGFVINPYFVVRFSCT
jgi:hypothetical protein